MGKSPPPEAESGQQARMVLSEVMVTVVVMFMSWVADVSPSVPVQ